MPVEDEADVEALFEKAASLSEREGRWTREDLIRGVQDHFYYLGAVRPHLFKPFQDELLRLPSKKLSNFSFGLHVWLYLLRGLPENAVDRLVRRLHQEAGLTLWALEQMLASVCSPAALSALAEWARLRDRVSDFADMGFWIPKTGQAEPRFSPWRRAVRVHHRDCTVDELRSYRHPVGLPLAEVFGGADPGLVTWHYFGLDLSEIDAVPETRLRVAHLVGPPFNVGWTVFASPSDGGHYREPTVQSPDALDADEPEFVEHLRQDARDRASDNRGELELLPYDDRLIYCNGHTQQTEGVHGDVGGPPIGLYSNPACPGCSKLMFHVCSVADHVRPYGDGFRCLYLCEDCDHVASRGVSWN